MTMDVIFSSLHHCHRFRGGVGGVAAMTIRVSVFTTIVEAKHTGFSRSDRSDNDSDRDRCHQADSGVPESLLLSSIILLPMQSLTMVVSNAVYWRCVGIA